MHSTVDAPDPNSLLLCVGEWTEQIASGGFVQPAQILSQCPPAVKKGAIQDMQHMTR